MKALLYSVFLIIGDPYASLTIVTPIETRIVCEVREGMLNKPLMSDAPILEYKGLKVKFVYAQCQDMPKPKKARKKIT